MTVTKTEPEQGTDSVLGIDRGVAVLAAAASELDFDADPGFLLGHGPELEERLHALRRQIKDLQRQRAAKKKYSRAWRLLSKRIKRLHGKAARVTETGPDTPRRPSLPSTASSCWRSSTSRR